MICALIKEIKVYLRNVFILIFSLFAMAGYVESAEINLSFEPAVSHIIIAPNKSIVKTFKITNLGDPTILNLKVAQVSIKNNTGEMIIQNTSEEIDESVQITTTDKDFPLQEPFLIKSQEAFEFDIKIEVSSLAKNQDIYLALFAETNTSDSFTDRSRILIESATGSLILLSVTDNSLSLYEDISLVLFEPKKYTQVDFFGQEIYLINSTSPAPFSAFVANKSSNLSFIEGKINIQNTFSKKTTSLPIKKQLLFAESTKEITNSNTSFLPKNLFGAYKVTLDLKKNISSNYLNEIVIIAIPFQILLIIFVLLIIAVISLTLYKKCSVK